VEETSIAIPSEINATVAEFWNTEDGTLLLTEPVSMDSNQIILQLPAFQRAIGIKIH